MRTKYLKYFVVLSTIVSLISPSSTFAANAFDVDTAGTLTTSLVSYYQLDDANDAFGTNHLTNTGVTFTTGKILNGEQNDASGDNLRVATSLAGSGNFSMSFWLKLDTEISSAQQDIIWNADPTNDVTHGVRYEYNGGTRRLVLYRGRRGTTDNFGYYNITLGTTNYYHILVTGNQTDYKLYVNGSLVLTFTDSGAGLDGLAASFTVGNNDSSVFSIRGVIDEVGVWTKILSSQEITDLYNSGSANPYRAQAASSRKLRGVGISR